MNALKKSSRHSARRFAVFRLSVGALLLAATFAAGAAGEIYRWKDSAGQWHYGDQPPADQQAEQFAVQKAPTTEGDAAVDPDASADGSAAEPARVTEPRTVREVQRGCASLVTTCVTEQKADRGQCLANVRQCAADPTREKQECCPAACGIRYATLRAQGLPDGLAFSRAIFSAPSCVPGADDAPSG